MPTVITVDRSWDGEYATASSKGGRKVLRRYEAFTDDDGSTTEDVQVIEALGVQHGVYRNTVFPDFISLFCTDITCRRDSAAPHKFTIDVIYEEPLPAPGSVFPGASNPAPPGMGETRPESSPPEPWERPPLPTMDAETIDVYDAEDLDGEPLVNTAGDPLIDTPPLKQPLGTIVYTRWFETWNVNASLFLVGGVNDAPWEGLAVFTVLIDRVTAKPKEEKGRAFWEVVMILKVDPRGWIPTLILNRGRNQILDGEKVPITGEDGRELHDPQLLDEDGALASTPYYLERTFFVAMDFADI